MAVASIHKEVNVLSNFATRLSFNKKRIIKKIKGIQLGRKYGTRIDKGLEKVHDDLFSKDGGDRENFPNVLFVFTDGKPFPPDKVKPFNETLPPLRVSMSIGRN